MGGNSRTRPQAIMPLPVKDVTATCIKLLKAVPLARGRERFAVSPALLEKGAHSAGGRFCRPEPKRMPSPRIHVHLCGNVSLP